MTTNKSRIDDSKEVKGEPQRTVRKGSNEMRETAASPPDPYDEVEKYGGGHPGIKRRVNK